MEQPPMPAPVAREALSGPAAAADALVIDDPDLVRRLRRVAQTLGMAPATYAAHLLARGLRGGEQTGA